MIRSKKVINVVYRLYDKPVSYKFTPFEIKLILEYLKGKRMKVYYAILKKSRGLGQVVYAIDDDPRCPRHSPILNQWDIVAIKNIPESDLLDLAENWGTHHRRFKVWNYECIEDLVSSDSSLGIKTPEKFIKRCKELNLTRKVNPQLEFELQF